MKLDMAKILSGATDTLSFSYTFHPEETPDDVPEAEDGVDYIPIAFDDVTYPEPIAVTGTVTNRAGYMRLAETAVLTYDTHCARCLEPVHGQMTFTLEKTVAEKLENEDDDDYVRILDGMLDLDAPVRDEILLSFPMRILCKEDCRGLCAGCGANLNTESCRCRKKTVDPRFASLAALLDDMEDEEASSEDDDGK